MTAAAAEGSALPVVMVVDDEPELRGLLTEYFGRNGCAVRPAADAAEARALVAAGRPDIAILDVNMPGENGLSLARWLRAGWPGMGLLMLTTAGEAVDRVVGLELGADDYLPKPFEPRELVARIKAVLRRGSDARARAQDSGTASFAGWRFDRLRRELCARDDTVVPLSAAEYRLLAAFVDHPGRVLSRERLLELSRASGVVVSDRSVDLAVSRLRAKLGDAIGADGARPIIRTLRGEGYMFDVKVSG